MSQENLELVRRTFDALVRHAYPEAARGFREDAVWQNTATFPGPRRCVGRDAIVDFWATMIEDFEDGGGELERVVERDDTVAIGVHSIGRGRTSDVPIDVRWAAVFEVHDGEIARVEVHGDWSKALKAVGLEE
jgi:ketosteroid isomerase-like protein